VKRVEIGKCRSFKNRDDWRAWLAQNHARATELWLVFYKENSGKRSVSYDEAVEEALCFGWIDGIVKTIDGEEYARRFSPRRRGSIWSESNKRRVARMIAQGRMTEIGLARVEEAKRNGEWDKATPREDVTDIPRELEQALQGNKQAQRNFNALPPSQKRMYIYWITEAKKDETRQRRLRAVVRMLKENKRIGIDTRMGDRE
jgi:uncharacterized protein YdeI (YjbR/CyaY-like superfamily)